MVSDIIVDDKPVLSLLQEKMLVLPLLMKMWCPNCLKIDYWQMIMVSSLSSKLKALF